MNSRVIAHLALFLLVAEAILSCKQGKLADNVYYSSGVLKEMTIVETNSSKTTYEFYENGIIKSMKRINAAGDVNGEQLTFYPSGFLYAKGPFMDGRANGNTYYFFDKSGALKNFRFFRDNKEVLYGGDYWGDSMDLMKASLHFNDSGQLFYKKNFDENGKLISEEGKKE